MNTTKISLKSLKEVTSYISRGITPSYDEFEGIPVINQRCIRNNTIDFSNVRLTNPSKKKINKDKYLQEWDVLVNSTGVGTLGRSAQIKEITSEITVDSHVTILRPNSLVDPLFFGYSVQYSKKLIEGLAEGSTGQTELSRVRIGEEILIPIHSLKNQEKIGKILSRIDKKISINNKINQNLEKQMQTIFNNYFIDFKNYDDPEMVNSKLGLIPKDWTIVKLNDLVIKNNEKIKEFDDWKDELLIDLSNMPRFSMSLSNFDKGEKLNSNIYKLNKFDLLFGSIRPYFGKAGFSPIDGVRAGTILSFKPKNNIYYSFLLALIVSKKFINYTVSVSKGTKMPSVKWKDFVDYDVVIPKNEYIMEDFNNKLIGFIFQVYCWLLRHGMA